MDLFIKSTNLFTWRFDVFEDGVSVAEIDLNLFKEGADLRIKDETFRFFREGLVSGAYVLEAYGREIARADKPSVFKRRFAVHFGGRRFILEDESIFRRTFVVREEPEDGIGVEVGRVKPVGIFRRSARARFDDDIPLAVNIFLIGLVVLMWRRSSRSKS